MATPKASESISEERGLPECPFHSPGSPFSPRIFFERARFAPDPRMEFFRTGGSGNKSILQLGQPQAIRNSL